MSTSPDQALGAGPGGAGAPEAPRPGLRERKKAKTKATIREQAMRLFREQGYDATTVEQIADAAEVSPSTFFRYFPTKEDVVLQDDMELLWAEALRAQPPDLSPVAALRAAVRDAFSGLSPDDLARLRESADLTLNVPAIRARSLDEFSSTIETISVMVGERAGRAPDDPAVRTLAGAVLGIAMSSWFGADGSLDKFAAQFERALEMLEAGLPL
jgi:AcrR family transcriptional regulator